jgi:hypothetical protein
MKNLALRSEHILASQIQSDEFDSFAGTTVYRTFDKGNGQKLLAIGYLSRTATLSKSDNPFHEVSENKEIASVSEENNITQISIDGVTDITDISQFKKIPAGEKERVNLAHFIYYNYVSGLIRSYVDFLADIAFDGFRHTIDKSKPNADDALKWFDEWAKQIRLRTVLMNAFHDMFITNNALLWCLKAPYVDRFFEDLIPIAKARNKNGVNKSTAHFTDINAATLSDKDVFGDNEIYYVYNKSLGRCLDQQEIKEYAARKLRWTKTQIPSHIFNLPAHNTDITGGRYPGMRRYTIHIDADTRRFIASNSDFVSQNFPPELATIFNKNDSRAKSDMKGQLLIAANEDSVFQISIRRKDWEVWGQPSWLGVLSTLSKRREKLNTDQIAANKLIKQLVLVTIGDKDFPATENQLRAAAALFRNPSASFTVFWNHTMQVQFLGPKDLADMMGNQTYEPLDKEIAESMGFPLALFGVGNANFATMSKQILPVKHKVESARMAMLECFLIPLYDAIHKIMGWESDTIKPKFNTNILEDPSQLVKRLMMYLDHRAVPYRDVVEALPEGYSFDELIESFKQEKSDIDAGLYGDSQVRKSFGRPIDDPDPASPDDMTKTPEGEGDTRNSMRDIQEANSHRSNGSR